MSRQCALLACPVFDPAKGLDKDIREIPTSNTKVNLLSQTFMQYVLSQMQPGIDKADSITSKKNCKMDLHHIFFLCNSGSFD